MRIPRGLPNQLHSKLFAQLRQRLSRERAIRHLAGVTRQPRFTDLLVKLSVGINRRQIRRSPRPRIKRGQHSNWVKLAQVLNPYKTGRLPWRPALSMFVAKLPAKDVYFAPAVHSIKLQK